MIKILINCLISLAFFMAGCQTILYLSFKKDIEQAVNDHCSDTEKDEAFLIVKDGDTFCFLRGKRYPHRIRGGILVQ
jgi:hypothetical protein